MRIFIVTTTLVSLLVACGSNNKSDPTQPTGDGVSAPAQPQPAATAPAAEAPAGVELTGVIIKKPWSKSTESWNAGGSEYYVLDVGATEVEKRSAKEGVTLRASAAVSAEQIAELTGKKVRVRGTYIPAKPYTPEDPMEQYPTGMDGKPLPRGAGFEVTAIESAE